MHPLHYLGHDAGRPTSCLRSSVQHVEDFVQALTQSAQRCLGVVDAAEAELVRRGDQGRGRAEAEAKAAMEAKGRKHERTQAIWADHLYDVRLRFVMRTCFLALHREVLREGRRRPSQGQGEEARRSHGADLGAGGSAIGTSAPTPAAPLTLRAALRERRTWRTSRCVSGGPGRRSRRRPPCHSCRQTSGSRSFQRQSLVGSAAVAAVAARLAAVPVALAWTACRRR